MSARDTQRGSLQVTVATIIIVLVVAAGAISYLSVHLLTKSVASSVSPSASPVTSTNKVAQKVQSFYETYADNPSANARKSFVTASLAATLNAESNGPDPVLCARNLPTSVSTIPFGTLANGDQAIEVNEQFPTSHTNIVVGIQPSTGLIDQINCPANTVTSTSSN